MLSWLSTKNGNGASVASLIAKKAMKAKFEAARVKEEKRKKELWQKFLAEQSPMREKIETTNFYRRSACW